MSRLTVESSAKSASSLAGLFSKFKGEPEPQFLDTIQSVVDADAIPDIMEAAVATQLQAEDLKGIGGDLEGDSLPLNNLCSILKYCAEDTEPPFYAELNRRSYNRDRRAIRPFLSFMYLLMKTLEKLQPYEGTVFRGVTKNLLADHPEGKKIVWHAFTSTTKSIGVLDNPMFLGSKGERTIFHIELRQKQARDISKFSPLEEGEVLLPPGCRFQVKSSVSVGHGLCMITLLELPSSSLIIDLCPEISVTPEDVAKIFKSFDTDRNGRISRKELSDLLVRLGMEASDVSTIISEADRDNSGDLDFGEFTSWVFTGSKTAKMLQLKFMESSSHEETIIMWHGTSEANAQRIARTGHLEASKDGLMGPGAYVTSSKKKALTWAMTHSVGGWGKWVDYHQKRHHGKNVAVVSVRVAYGRCKNIEADKDVVEVHMKEYNGENPHFVWPKPPPDGMVMVSQGGNYGYAEQHLYTRRAELQSWIEEGYDSQYMVDALPAEAIFDLGGAPDDESLLLLKGDELVVSDGRRATYESHEVLQWSRCRSLIESL